MSPALQQTELEAIGKTTTIHGNMEVRDVQVHEKHVHSMNDEFSERNPPHMYMYSFISGLSHAIRGPPL